MKMRVPADRRVVEAVVAALRTPAEDCREQLSALGQSEWARSYYWLDASGLALYLLARLEELSLEDAIPVETLERLRTNRADNRERVETMFAEFVSLNNAFQGADVSYANLKGFTLSPEWCADPALRRALDLDFLVDGRHLGFCRELLEYHGYILTAATEKTWEFKAGVSTLARIEDLYKSMPQRTVELHFASSSVSSLIQASPCRDERLDRLVTRSWAGFRFPALDEADQFVAQARHLFSHLMSACTRPAWLLEYKHMLCACGRDTRFWDDLRDRAQGRRETAVAIGLGSVISTALFGGSTSPQLDAWTLDRMPDGVRRWAELYGRRAVLADIPGTKLYLLLHREVKSGDEGQRRRTRRRHLMPVQRPPRIVYAGASDDLWTRLAKEIVQARFVLFRARFHVVEGFRYLVEAWRWKQRRDAGSVPVRVLAACNPSEAND